MEFSLQHDRHKRGGDLPRPVCICYYSSSPRIQVWVNTEIKVKAEDWDSKRQRVRRSHPKHENYNQRLQKIISECQEAKLKAVLKNVIFTGEMFKALVKKNNPASFSDFIIQEMTNDRKLSQARRKSYKSTFNHLISFNGGKSVSFAMLNPAFAIHFQNYLIDQGKAHNTVSKYLIVLKAVYARALRIGLANDKENPFKVVKTGFQQTDRSYLSMAQIERIIAVDTTDNHFLDRIKDMFLFACYTGLRYSDLTRLNESNFEFISEDEVNLIFKAQKTGKTLSIPLHHIFKDAEGKSRPLAIYLKYRDIWSVPGGYFQASNQHYNRELKELGKMANINFPLTSHVARHTFGRYMAMRLPLPVVQLLLQHSKIEQTMIYARAGQKEIEEALKKVIWEVR